MTYTAEPELKSESSESKYGAYHTVSLFPPSLFALLHILLCFITY